MELLPNPGNINTPYKERMEKIHLRVLPSQNESYWDSELKQSKQNYKR